MSMHNAAPFLRECIDSVLAQSFADFEFLIVDDGSTDSSATIAASYTDPRLCIISRPHGFIESLNTLLSHAQGEYIARMDADDIMLPHRLHAQVSYLDTHPAVDAVSSCATRIDATGRPTGHIGNHSDSPVTITPRMMCEANHVCNPSTMIRRSAIESRSLSYDPAFEWAEDYAFWASLIGSGGVVHCLPDTLLLYRHSQGQVTSLHYDEMMEASDRIRRSLTRRLVAEANPGYTDPQLPESPHSLTLIIPFLNEGEEVGRTVRSFLDHGGKGRVEVMVINDCSYDSYPYLDALSQNGGVTYILNSERLGVAASRDKGVSLCTTPYFLLLDAHMRAYDDLWVTEIPRLLSQNDRRILCCQNKPLKVEDAKVVSDPSSFPTFGARLSFGRKGLIPGIKWINEEHHPDSDTETIPAVLGAGYAAGVSYWKRIGGLRGLVQYGCDEQMLSLKTWLEGGECVLLKRVVLGHIYRDNMPYAFAPYCMVHNSLLISELLLPLRERCQALAAACINDRELFMTAYADVRKYLASDPSAIATAKTLSARDFNEVLTLNLTLSSLNRSVYSGILDRLPEIASVLMSEPCDGPGLFTGSMSRAIWLFHYSRYSADQRALSAADRFLSRSLESLDGCNPSFADGLSGIGWGLIYLYTNGFIPLPVQEISKIISLLSESIADGSIASHGCAPVAFACTLSVINSKLSGFSQESRLLLNKMAIATLDNSSDAVELYFSFLWMLLASREDAKPAPQLSDWIAPTNFLASDRRFWSLSLLDGVLATSINVMINHQLISVNEQ